MARRRRRSDQSYDRNERDLSNVATAVRAVLDPGPVYLPTPTASVFTELQDYRTFHPDGELRDPLTVSGSPAVFGVSYGNSAMSAPYQ